MTNRVTFNIQVDDNGTFKNVTVSAEDLKEQIGKIIPGVGELEEELVNLSHTSQLLSNLTDVIGKINKAFQELSDAYAIQSQAETRLAQAMRNTMNASDAEIESIKQLASAQQQIGIVGDEVQLAASQELATYLEFSDSLKTLIPVMNDMVAQQLGLGASAESATQIASMLGKVMNGQTEALSRYGYKFDDAQKQILKFGTEEERAAILAQVVTDAVGGVNEAIAKTPVGRMQQAANTLGDWKEELGRIAVNLMPVVSGAAQLGEAAVGIQQLGIAVKALKIDFDKLKTAMNNARNASIAMKAAMGGAIVAAIAGVVAIIAKLSSKSKEAATDVIALQEATDAYKSTAIQMRTELAMEIVALEDLIKSKQNEKGKVQELNNKYGEAFGLHQTAAEWYDTLTQKSSVYCKMLGYEAKAKVLASKAGEANMRLEDLQQQAQAYVNAGDTSLTRTAYYSIAGNMVPYQEETPYGKLLKQISDAEKEVKQLTEEFTSCNVSITDLYKELGYTANATNDNNTNTVTFTNTLAELKKNLADVAESNRLLGQEEKTYAAQAGLMESAIRKTVTEFGAESKEVKALTKLYDELKTAKLASRGEALQRLPGISPAGGVQYDNTINIDRPKPVELVKPIGDNVMDSISSITQAMGALNGVVGEGAAGWLSWGASLLQTIAQALPMIAQMIGGNIALAFSGAAGQSQSVPFPFNLISLSASMAAVGAAVASIPKFASGGIAYGPTLGLFGEYAGASNNPEVVAPLDRLRSLIQPDDGGMQTVEFRIEERTLVGILNKSNRLRGRNG